MLTPFALALALVVPGADTTHQDERTEVLAVVQRFFDTMRTKDTATMRTLFEPNARLTGMRTRPDGEEALQVLAWQRFAEFVANDTRGPWIERAWEPRVDVRGSLAHVWAMYDFHFGPTPSHCGVDSVQLLKTTAGWRIVAIADTYESSGCPARPAPSP